MNQTDFFSTMRPIKESDRRCLDTDIYPSVGNLITPEEIKVCASAFVDRQFVFGFDCVQKSMVAASLLQNEERGNLEVHIGSCIVFGEGTSYGHAINPPFEFHAWIFSPKQNAIYDLGLPGLIHTGLNTSDEYGPFLSGVDPVVMAEKVEDIPKPYLYIHKDYNTARGAGKATIDVAAIRLHDRFKILDTLSIAIRSPIDIIGFEGVRQMVKEAEEEERRNASCC